MASRIEIRQERNKSFLEDIRLQIKRVNGLRCSQFRRYDEMHNGIETLLLHYWSWYDMICFLGKFHRKMHAMEKESEFEECVKSLQPHSNVINLTYGNWVLEDVIELTTRLVLDFPDVFEALEKEETK